MGMDHEHLMHELQPDPDASESAISSQEAVDRLWHDLESPAPEGAWLPEGMREH